MPKRHSPKTQKISHIRYRYGLEPEEYKKMFEDQDHKCFTCGKLSGDTKGTRLYVDHDHETGQVRKLLCARCNQIAGAIEDKRYEAVKDYLALARAELRIRAERQ